MSSDVFESLADSTLSAVDDYLNDDFDSPSHSAPQSLQQSQSNFHSNKGLVRTDPTIESGNDEEFAQNSDLVNLSLSLASSFDNNNTKSNSNVNVNGLPSRPESSLGQTRPFDVRRAVSPMPDDDQKQSSSFPNVNNNSFNSHNSNSKSLSDLRSKHKELSTRVSNGNKPLTKPKPSRFDQLNASKLAKQSKSLETQFKARPFISPPRPISAVQMTAKQEQIRLKNLKLLEQRHKKEEIERKEIEQQEKLIRQNDMRLRIQKALISSHSFGSMSTDEKIKQITRQAQKERREADRLWREKVLAMKNRVRERPLLIESYNTQNDRIAARKKALLAIKDSLQKAGVKDLTKFFDKEELLDLGIEI